MNDKPTAIIMAGGKSSRMAADKGLMKLNGKYLVQITIEKVLPFCSNLMISTQNTDYMQFGFPLLADEISNLGPIGGISTALKKASSTTILVIACDMPLVSTDTIGKLIENMLGYDCVVPRIEGRLEPLCAIYSTSMLSLIEKNIGEGNLALHTIIEQANHHVIDFDPVLPDFLNINTPADYEKIKSLSI